MEPKATTKKRKIELAGSECQLFPKIAKTNTTINRSIASCLIAEQEIDPKSVVGLNRLIVKGLNLRAKRVQILCSAMESINTIEEAIFENCNGFDLSDFEQLIEMLKKQPDLTRLDITGCELQDDHLSDILTLLASNTLQILSLPFNRIQSNLYWLIGDWMSRLTRSTSLVELNFTDNPIGAYGEETLANMLQFEGCSIKRLYLKNTNIGGVEIAKALATNQTLELLDLEGATDKNVPSEITLALQTNTTLKVLSLNRVVFDKNGSVFMELIRALQSKSLIYLGLDGTNLLKDEISALEKYFRERREIPQLSHHERQLVIAITQNEAFFDDGVVEIVEYNANKTWNFLEERPDILPAIRGGNRLNARLHEDQETMRVLLQRSFCQFERENKSINKQNDIVRSNYIKIEKEISELRAELKALKKRLPNRKELVTNEINALRMHLKYPIAKTNIEKLNEEIDDKIERRRQFREKIKTKSLDEWSQADVVELMKLINAPSEAIKGIEMNGITGKILIGLTTQDITNRLKMSFIDAKRLQTYILLLKNKKDIFSKLESPVLNWTNKRVLEWLEENELQALVSPFQNKCITGQELLTIDSHDLGSVPFKIKTLAVKVAFEEAIKKLRSQEIHLLKLQMQ